MEIVSNSVHGFRLTLEIPDSLKKNEISVEQAKQLADIAYKPFVDRLALLFAYIIGSQDVNMMYEIEEVIKNMAKSRIESG